MILSDRDIRTELHVGQIKIEGLHYKDIGPASVDLYLGDSFTHPDGTSIISSGGYSIYPLEFVLATTREVVTLSDDIMAQVHGCSSIGRTGLFVQNAGLVDPGFSGQITLELFNASSQVIRLVTGQRICQLSFARLSSACLKPYGERGRYQNQRGATATKPPRSAS